MYGTYGQTKLRKLHTNPDPSHKIKRRNKATLNFKIDSEINKQQTEKEKLKPGRICVIDKLVDRQGRDPNRRTPRKERLIYLTSVRTTLRKTLENGRFLRSGRNPRGRGRGKEEK